MRTSTPVSTNLLSRTAVPKARLAACVFPFLNLTMYSGEPDNKPQDASLSVTVARRVAVHPRYVEEGGLLDLSKRAFCMQWY